MLFGENGARLVHHYRVFGECVLHSLLRGSAMADLLQFTNRACSDARSAAKRGRDTRDGSAESPGRPVSLATTCSARKSARAVNYASSDES